VLSLNKISSYFEAKIHEPGKMPPESSQLLLPDESDLIEKNKDPFRKLNTIQGLKEDPKHERSVSPNSKRKKWQQNTVKELRLEPIHFS